MTWEEPPEDYWSDAKPDPAGGGFNPVVRLPWWSEARRIKQNGRRLLFAQEAQALRAASNFSHHAMCPHLRSDRGSDVSLGRAQAEKQFAKVTSNG